MNHDEILDSYQLQYGDNWQYRYDMDMKYGKIPFCSEEEFLAMAKHMAQELDYKSGWIAHKFKRMYAEWPNDHDIDAIQPVMPDEEFMQWLKKTYRRGKRK